MGFDINDLFGQAKDAINNGIQQVETVGVPALTAAAEKWGADVLTKQANENQAAVNKAVASAPAAAPGSFAASVQGVFKNTVASQYSVPILIGVVVIGIIVLRKV